MALRGMPSYRAVEGSWAKVMPPSALMSSRPSVPSAPVPEKTIPIAPAPWLSASERMKKLTARCWPGPLLRGVSVNVPSGNRHESVRGNHIHAIRLYPYSRLDLLDRHRGGFRNDLRQHAVMAWVKVLHQHKCHSGVGRQRMKKFLVRFQPARRSPDGHNRKSSALYSSVSARRTLSGTGTRFGRLSIHHLSHKHTF